MEIRGERATVSERVTAALVLAARDMRDEFARALVPLSDVALVHCVIAAMRRHLHVFLPQDELAETAIEGENIDAVAGSVDELRARAVQDISRDELRGSRPEEILYPAAVFGGPLLHREDCAERSVYVSVRGPVDRIVEYA